MAEDICQDTNRIYELWKYDEELALKNKAVGKYGVELSPFDALLGISPMSKLTDKELENEQKIAAATFTALDEIEKIANETIDPTDKKAGDK